LWWWFRNEIFWFFWFETEKCRGLLRGEKKRKRLLFSLLSPFGLMRFLIITTGLNYSVHTSSWWMW
jgi:hypothetical protein